LVVAGIHYSLRRFARWVPSRRPESAR
jgi:hypothetical protein